MVFNANQTLRELNTDEATELLEDQEAMAYIQHVIRVMKMAKSKEED